MSAVIESRDVPLSHFRYKIHLDQASYVIFHYFLINE